VARWSTYIMVVRVEKVSKEKRVIIYRKVRDIKGRFPKDEVKHVFNKSDPPANEPELFKLNVAEWSYILNWAEPGKEAVILAINYPGWGYYNHVYIDQCWYGNYCPRLDWTWWHTLYSRQDMLSKWHCGSPAKLASALEAMQAGKEGVTTILSEGSLDDLRLGKARVRGLKTSLKITEFNPKRDAVDLGEDARGVETLVHELKGKDEKLRLQAARGLEQWFGPEVKAAAPALVEALRAEDCPLRKFAASALAHRSLEPSTAVPALTEALKDKDRDVRMRAADSLGIWGTKAKAAVPILTEWLKGRDGLLVEAAAAALVRIDEDLEKKTPAITQALQRKASVRGNYFHLSARIKVPQDLTFSAFQDRASIIGMSPAVRDYQGYKDLPKGYWVYIYPYWYLWAERAGE
jgi:hypothetical protein